MTDGGGRARREQSPGQHTILRPVVPRDYIDTVMLSSQQSTSHSPLDRSNTDSCLSQLSRRDSTALTVRDPGDRTVWAVEWLYTDNLAAHT